MHFGHLNFQTALFYSFITQYRDYLREIYTPRFTQVYFIKSKANNIHNFKTVLLAP